MDFIVAHTGTLVVSLGLISDIIGVCLIFQYGLPPSIDRSGITHLITGDIDENEISKGR